MDEYLKEYCQINNFNQEEMENKELMDKIIDTLDFNFFILNKKFKKLFSNIIELFSK